jgi:hypothetical protein
VEVQKHPKHWSHEHVLVDELCRHVERYAGPGAEGLVFRGEKGAILRRGNFGRSTKWQVVVAAAGLPADFTSTISGTPVTSLRPTPARQPVN